MENIEYSFIIDEMKELVGNRFEKMQELNKGKLVFKMGKERIVCELGKRMNIAYNIESGSSENNFVQRVRKELKGLKLDKIYQYNKDRIIVFEFQGAEAVKNLIFEMFGKGNAILVEGGITLACYKWENWSDREIKPKKEYKFPKSNIVEGLEDAISEKYIISCMLRLPLGKRYVKEILKRVEVEEKTPGNKLKKEDVVRINKEIEKLKKEFNAVGFYQEGKLVDYGLIEFKEYENLEKKKFQNLSEIIDVYYREKPKGKSEKIKKLEKRLEQQEKQLKELKKKAREYKEIGDKIYEKYNEIEEILKKEKNKRKIKIEF